MDKGDNMKYSELKNRLGRFIFPEYVLEANPRAIMTVLGDCVVTKAEHLWHIKAIQYYAMSMQFKELKEGDTPPLYTWTISGLENTASVVCYD